LKSSENWRRRPVPVITSSRRSVVASGLSVWSSVARCDVFRRGRIDHIGIVGADFFMQALGRVRKQIAVLMNRAPLHRHTIPDGGDRS
jgi:hypothetical protein